MGPLDERYLTWLYSLVGDVKVRSRRKSYDQLFRALYGLEFVWFVPNDDNRMADGLDLRDEFLAETASDGEDLNWQVLGCSFLEMLVGLARRLSFEADGETRVWFWHLISNLYLDRYSDDRFDEDSVEEIVMDVIWRTYSPNGQGGIFPLKHPDTDQTKVEIWYQMSAYILEQD